MPLRTVKTIKYICSIKHECIVHVKIKHNDHDFFFFFNKGKLLFLLSHRPQIWPDNSYGFFYLGELLEEKVSIVA